MGLLTKLMMGTCAEHYARRCFETTLICRTYMGWGPGVLLIKPLLVAAAAQLRLKGGIGCVWPSFMRNSECRWGRHITSWRTL